MTALVASSSPVLWFLNRSSGVVVLVLLTLSLALGIYGAGRSAGGRLPAFVPQSLHRNLSVLALGLTAAHAGTAIADSYVDIRWWQAFSPLGGTYRPLWMGLGAVAFDLMIVLALSTWSRRALGPRSWHRLHLTGYAVWPIAFAHGAGIGTDTKLDWTRWVAAGCLVLLVLATAARLRRRTEVLAAPLPDAAPHGVAALLTDVEELRAWHR